MNINIITNFSGAELENSRTKFFKDAASAISFDKSNIECDVYFDSDLIKSFKDDKTVLDLLQLGHEPKNLSQSIFDVSLDLFDNQDLESLMALYIVCAGHITCASEILQEKIYLSTGRLASIVKTPLSSDDFLAPDTNNDSKVINEIIWYGTVQEIFSVRLAQTKYKNEKLPVRTILTKNFTTNRLNSIIANADIIYFPKTFDATSEFKRVEKVKECLCKGKFVVASDLPLQYKDIAFDGSLKSASEYYKKNKIQNWIENKQNLLLKIENKENSLNQLKEALALAPYETFLTSEEDDINYYL